MALSNITVLEFDGLAPVPFCGLLLADFGAEVIHIDRTLSEADLSAYPLSRGKKSIVIDLKHPKAKQVIYKLIKKVDVVIEPFRPGVMERLSLGPDQLLKHNPRLIYARLTGFGQTGTYSQMAGHDINYLAVSGVLGNLGRADCPPTPPANLLGDFAAGGLLCAFGILVSLIEREKSGKGQVIDSAMADGALYMASHMYKLRNLPIWDKPRGKNMLDGGAPFYNTFECKDGKFFSVGAVERKFYQIFLEKLELLDKVRVQDQMDSNTWDKTQVLIEKKFLTKTRDEWQKIFDGSDACAVPVLDMSELSSHPHNASRGVLMRSSDSIEEAKDPLMTHEPVPAPRLSRTPATTTSTPVPWSGTHTVVVLQDKGFSHDEIQLLLQEKVVSVLSSKL